MRLIVGIVGGLLVLLVLAEIFVAFLLPRRVKRDPVIVRHVFDYGWRPWRRIARRLPDLAQDTMLGVYGPFGLLVTLLLWIGVLMVGFACLEWAAGSHLGPSGAQVSFGEDLYYSAATLTTDGPPALVAHSGPAKALQVITAGCGLVVLAVVISYLPSLYQALTRREATVSQLDSRAGTPPSAGRLLLRSVGHQGWPAVNRYLAGWEPWVADLMETHLAYPVLAYFRSQHIHQNWLAALCTVLDACAFTISAAPVGAVDESRFTFAIARHAVADLAYNFNVVPTAPPQHRLSEADLEELIAKLSERGVELAADRATVATRLATLRAFYEPYVQALAERLELSIPAWFVAEGPTDNWRTTQWH
jgi:hypothetical protein